MNLEEDDLREIYDDIERVILAGTTASAFKKVKHDYMLTPNESEAYLKAFYIAAAQIRQGIESIFLKYIDKDLMQKVKEESEKRKRPRKKVEVTKQDKVVGTSKIGKLTVSTFE